MKIGEIRELPETDINDEIAKRRKKLFEHRFSAQHEEKQRAGEIRQLKQEIARMKTVQRERQIESEKGGGADDRG